MNKRSILYVESTRAMGGQELATLRYVRGLSRRGHRVVLAIRPDSPMQKPASQTGVAVESVGMSKANITGAILRLVGILNRHQIEIVQANSSLDSWLLAAAVRLARRRPYFIRIRHISAPLNRSPLTRLLYRKLIDRIIVTGGEGVRRDLIERDGLDADRVDGIPIGYDRDQFEPRPRYRDLRRELGLPGDHRLVGIIAYLRHYKGHRTLIESAGIVCRQFADVTFVIVGEGPERAGIREQVRRTGLEKRVILLGYREDLPDIYQSLDIFVHPSTEGDTLPQSILQAMGMGKPVIATPVGSIPDAVIEGENGFIVPVINPEKLADRVLYLLGRPDTMRKMGEKGKETVKRFTIDRGLDQLERVYAGLPGDPG